MCTVVAGCCALFVLLWLLSNPLSCMRSLVKGVVDVNCIGVISNMEDDKKYVIVTFMESQDEDDPEVVPSIWLTDNQSQCWWPKTKNIRSLIKCRAVPNANSWSLHDVTVIRTYSTYEEAVSKLKRIIEDIRTDEELGRGCRKLKPKFCGSEEPKLISLSYERNTGKTIFEKSNPTTGEDDSEIDSVQSQALKPSTKVSAVSTNKDEDYIVEYEVQNLDSPSYQDLQTVIETGFAEVMAEFAKLTVLVRQNSARILQLENCLKNLGTSDFFPHSLPSGQETLSDLPINDIDSLKLFNEKLSDQEFCGHFVKVIEFLRGGKPDDFIRRVLAKCFTNFLGTQCSWTGIRGTAAVKTFKFVDIIEDITHKFYPSITKKEIDDVIAVWFRNSNQRLKKENKPTDV